MADERHGHRDAGTAKKRLSGLADHLLGYRITGDGGEAVHYGPQPYEAYISTICRAFGCSPREAERQDPALVHSILEYRLAQAAIECFNSGRKGVQMMQASPAMQAILKDLHEAQSGGCVDPSDLLSDMEGRGDDG